MKRAFSIVLLTVALAFPTGCGCDGDDDVGTDGGTKDEGTTDDGFFDVAQDAGQDATQDTGTADTGTDTGEKDGGGSDGGAGSLPWVVVAPGGRYFMTEDGKPFVPIGNQVASHFLDFESPVGWEAFIEEHLARMETYGENVLRIDLDYAPNWTNEPHEYVGIEADVGSFNNATHIDKLDRVFELARNRGVRVHVVPWITSPPMWVTWENNPYGRRWACPNDFMKAADAIQAFGDRLEWIAGRWGGTGTFFGWDLMNEAGILFCGTDGKCGGEGCTGDNDVSSLRDWILQTGARISSHETALYGRAHPRLVSWWGLDVEGDLGFLFNSAGLDATATHLYGSKYGSYMWDYSADPAKNNFNLGVLDAAIEVHQVVNRIVASRVTDRRPYIENERYFNDYTMPSFHREAEHFVSWAELASGAAGAGITWLHPEFGDGERVRVRHENLGPVRRGLSWFVDLVPPEFFMSDDDPAFDALSPDDRSRGEVAAISVRRGRHLIGWMAGRDETCILFDAVNEVRERYATTGSLDPPEEAGLAMMLWVERLLRGNGVAYSDPDYDGFVAELGKDARERKPAIVLSLIGPAFDALEADEKRTRFLGGLSANRCPVFLSPRIEFKMPAGDYLIDWVSDTEAVVVRTDPLPGGTGVLTAPAFERHLAVIVRPK
ncbi:MAG: hypothetical protein HY897_02825 [Deltaproteobacteria bacterium]|nr:hypothetical protein [Deltaproteobacteria bacterium]